MNSVTLARRPTAAMAIENQSRITAASFLYLFGESKDQYAQCMPHSASRAESNCSHEQLASAPDAIVMVAAVVPQAQAFIDATVEYIGIYVLHIRCCLTLLVSFTGGEPGSGADGDEGRESQYEAAPRPQRRRRVN